MSKPTQTLRFLWVVCAAAGMGAVGSVAIAAPATSATATTTTTAIGGEAPWPRTVTLGNTTLTVYAPQLDAWDGIKLSGRLAVQAQVGKDKP